MDLADNKRRSPLHYSVNTTTGGFETLTEVEDLLIKYDANTTALDLHSRVPLHYAFVKMNNRCVKTSQCLSSCLVEIRKYNYANVYFDNKWKPYILAREPFVVDFTRMVVRLHCLI